MRGIMVVFEGLDRSGKSTQTRKVLEEGRTPTELIAFPSRKGIIAEEISRLMSLSAKTETQLMELHELFARDRKSKQEIILAHLSKGKNVLVDRYAYSGAAYSRALGLGLSFCLKADAGTLQPDLVIYMDIPPKIAQGRPGYGLEAYEKLQMQEKVHAAYDEIFELLLANKELFLAHECAAAQKSPMLLKINANQDLQDIYKQVSDAIFRAETARRELPLRRLFEKIVF